MSETERLFKYYSSQSNYRTIRKGDNLYMTTAKSTHFNVYHFHWRLHAVWTLAIICFILAKLWWLVPLPGYDLLPAYRTYPASFLDNICLTLAGAFATRSIVIGLFRTLRYGIHPDSIIAFGSTGGYAAMWSCIKNRSGFRYFLVAMLVTVCSLLGSALQGELQSSLSVYYRVGGETSLNTAQCSHITQADYLVASSAFASGLISNTLSDATSLLDTLNASQPMRSFTISTIKTTLAPIQNVTFLPLPSGTSILRRHHYHHYHDPSTTTSTESTTVQHETESSTTATTVLQQQTTTTAATETTLVNDQSTATILPLIPVPSNNNIDAGNSDSTTSNDTINSSNEMSNNFIDTNLNKLVIPLSAIPPGGFNQSSILAIIRNSSDISNKTALPYTMGQLQSNEIPIQLNIFRYRTPENLETVIMYSSSKSEYNAGVYVTAIATNYTCQSRGDSVICDEGVSYTADSTVVANALVAAVQSGDGLYGTTTSGGLAMDIVNRIDSTGKNSKLVDSLFANPLCRDPELIPTLGHLLVPYTAGRITPLAILWLILFVIMWMIGVYLIGYTEHTWTKLAFSGILVPQIVSKSPNMFESEEVGAKPIDKEMYLDPETGRMCIKRVYREGFSISTTELEEQEA
ncbi:hypothetical protein EDC94DRAFT_119555 [Helicostylum pulchrum]|nr:hypothetical protein EDC94DRAFT_119555 [Helicostylum pulchrum]